MAALEDIIQINISRSSTSLTQVGFGTCLILGQTKETFADVVKTYTSTADVLVDFANNTPEYVMASKLFGQTNKPTKIKIAQKAESDSLIDAYTLAKTVDNDFYAVITSSIVIADVLALAAQIETEKRVFGTSSQSADVFNYANDNILAQLKALNYSRTILTATKNATLEKPESALFGDILPTLPGSTTLAYKTLKGITASKLTDTERNNVLNNNGNVFIPISGQDVVLYGKMLSGEYFDVIHGLDWLEQRIKENIFGMLTTISNSNSKVPYTNEGIALIRNQLEASLKVAVIQGIINADYTITTPDVFDVSSQDKADRILRNVTFTATLTGAINRTQINGTVSI